MTSLSDKDLAKFGKDCLKRLTIECGAIATHTEHLADWIPAASSGPLGEGRGGDISRPTERRAIPRTPEGKKDVWYEDSMVRARKRLEQNWRQIDEAIKAAEATGRALRVLEHHEAQALAEQETVQGVECVNPFCRCWITNLGEDRPRGGRCNACREFSRTHEGQERPHSLVHRQIEPDCAACARVKEAV